MKRVHPKKMYKCNECGNEYKSNTYLNSHIKTIHLKEKQKCDYCENTYSK